MSDAPDESTLVRFIRRALLAILVVGIVGTGVELLLLKHTEDFWQWAPLALMALALVALAWQGIRPGPASLRAVQGTMWLFVLSGAIGVFLHYRGNVAWELESMPGIGGLELFKKAIMGATPTLAPGTMLQLGLVGLLYAYRHPAARRVDTSTS